MSGEPRLLLTAFSFETRKAHLSSKTRLHVSQGFLTHSDCKQLRAAEFRLVAGLQAFGPYEFPLTGYCTMTTFIVVFFFSFRCSRAM